MLEMPKVYQPLRDVRSHEFAKWLLSMPDATMNFAGENELAFVVDGDHIHIDDVDAMSSEFGQAVSLAQQVDLSRRRLGVSAIAEQQKNRLRLAFPRRLAFQMAKPNPEPASTKKNLNTDEFYQCQRS
jgi:hypothetical protein